MELRISMLLTVAQLNPWTPGSTDSGNSLCSEGYGG